MINQDWWFTTLLAKQFKYCPPLTSDITCDVLIIGGGFSGVSAAAEFLRRGHKVVLLEKNILGGSSSGRSAGFLTPDSELELNQLVRRYGAQAAREIWDAPVRGIERIVGVIKKFDVECGLLEQDSLFLGLGKHGREEVEAELESRNTIGFTDQSVYFGDELNRVLGSEGFAAGIRYTGTYGVNPLLCLQGIKDLLIDHGTQVFESTEVIRIDGHTAYTRGGSVMANQIIIAVDKLKPEISPLADEVFHAQTFLSVSEPLTDKDLLQLFPSGESLQCWDSKLVYTYFRLTKDNRLLVGGGSAATTYLKEAYNNHRIISRVIRKFKDHFPFLRDLAFIQFWPGRIDATRDLLPIIVRPRQQPHLCFTLGAVGLPWAAFTGSLAARYILGEANEDYKKYSRYFSNRRYFTFPAGLGKIIGKPMLFSLSNAWAKFYQVDRDRKHVNIESEF